MLLIFISILVVLEVFLCVVFLFGWFLFVLFVVWGCLFVAVGFFVNYTSVISQTMRAVEITYPAKAVKKFPAVHSLPGTPALTAGTVDLLVKELLAVT